MPEATSADILAGMSDLWKWIDSDLQSFISQKATVAPQIDLAHVLVVGDSAGGWLAMQSAITQPAGSIKAVIGLYPQLDMRDHFFNAKFEKRIFGMPMLPTEIVDAHVAAMAPGAVVTSAYLPARLDLACSMVQNGRVLRGGQGTFPCRDGCTGGQYACGIDRAWERGHSGAACWK